jgi:hypothetical protein
MGEPAPEAATVARADIVGAGQQLRIRSAPAGFTLEAGPMALCPPADLDQGGAMHGFRNVAGSGQRLRVLARGAVSGPDVGDNDW